MEKTERARLPTILSVGNSSRLPQFLQLVSVGELETPSLLCSQPAAVCSLTREDGPTLPGTLDGKLQLTTLSPRFDLVLWSLSQAIYTQSSLLDGAV